MRIPYKSYPSDSPSTALPRDKVQWYPVIPVRVTDRRMQTQTKAFHAIVDSGSTACLFHSSFLQPFGIPLESGLPGKIGSIEAGKGVPVFYHDVGLVVAGNWRITIRAGFCAHLAVAGILGRYGFFDSFTVKFDHSMHPPVVEILAIEAERARP